MQREPQGRARTSGVAWVQPARSPKPIQFQCSAVENLCARVHHSVSQFFPIRSDANVDEIFGHLKQGLSLMLAEHPIIAGTLRQSERGDFSVEIPAAPKAGVALHFSDTSDDPNFPTFSELQECGFPYLDGDRDGLKELRPDPFPTNDDGQPTFIAKICHLRGGIVWTGSLSHLITDLAQGTALMVRWAHFTKQVTEAAGKPVPIPRQVPYPDRSRLLPPKEAPLSQAEINTFNGTSPTHFILDPTDTDKMLENIDDIFVKADVTGATEEQLEEYLEYTTGIWRFTPSKLRAMTDAVRRVDPSVKLSTFDIVTALIWQRLCVAKRGESRGTQPDTANIVTAINVRNKLNPPLPPTFLGACVDLVRVSVDRSVIEPQKYIWNGIMAIAKKVRQFGAEWSEAEYMNMLNLSLRTPLCPGILPKGPIDMLVTDHNLFALCLQADWGGELGRSVVLREPYIGRETSRGEVIIMPKQPNGDLEVVISAEEIVLQRLMGDAVLTAVSENVCVRHNVVEALSSIAPHNVKAKL